MLTRSCSRLSKAASCFGREQASPPIATTCIKQAWPVRWCGHVSGRKVLASPFNFAPLKPESSSVPRSAAFFYIAEVLLAALLALGLAQTSCSDCAKFDQLAAERRARRDPMHAMITPRRRHCVRMLLARLASSQTFHTQTERRSVGALPDPMPNTVLCC